MNSHADPFKIDQLRIGVNTYTPHIANRSDFPSHTQAAVALLLRQTQNEIEVLFILRAEFPGDPWSGNIAFPGGHIENDDGTARVAAERETFEEVGIDLSREEFLGRIDDVTGAHLPVIVSCFSYLVSEKTPIKQNNEIRETFWVPLSSLTDPARQRIHSVFFRGAELERPAIDLLGHGKPVLWGITYRLVCHFLQLIGSDSLPPTEIP